MPDLFQSSFTILRAFFKLKSDFFQVKTLQWIPGLVGIKSKLLNLVYKILCDLIPEEFFPSSSLAIFPLIHYVSATLNFLNYFLRASKNQGVSQPLGLHMCWSLCLEYFSSIMSSSRVFCRALYSSVYI